MHDDYAGDVGDFGKIALLRHLSQGYRLGVCWYRTTQNRGKKNNNDGKHTSYLKQPDKFKWLAPEVFIGLDKIVNNSYRARCIAALEDSGLLGRATFHDTVVPENSSRNSWAESLKRKMAGSDFVFLDPDNGIEGSRLTPKHVAVSEIAALRAKRRVLVVYHHQGRRKAEREADILRQRMKDAGWNPIELIRLRLFSSRFYIIAGHDRAMSERIKGFVGEWGEDRIAHYVA